MCGVSICPHADARMTNILLNLLHLAVVTAKLCGPGGVRAVVVENLPRQLRKILFNHSTDDFEVDTEVVVNPFVAQPGDLLPRDFRLS